MGSSYWLTCIASISLLLLFHSATSRDLKQEPEGGAPAGEKIQIDDTVGTLRSVDASFANTYAGDEQNDVEQKIYLFIPEPEEVKGVPVWVRDVIPQRVDPNNPICTLGDRDVYPKRTATNPPVGSTEFTSISFFSRPDYDIRPEVVVEFNNDINLSQGSVEITGPGVYARVSVDASTFKRTLCGNWAWSSFGHYTFEIRSSGATTSIEYYTREHVPSRSASFEEFPLTFNLKVHTTIAGNRVNVLSDSALQSQYIDGKLVVTLNNNITGDGNAAVQTARARVDGATGRDALYEY